MKWTDIDDIAMALADHYPQQDPTQVRFTELRQKVRQLDTFNDEHECNERILEAIQQSWIDKVE